MMLPSLNNSAVYITPHHVIGHITRLYYSRRGADEMRRDEYEFGVVLQSGPRRQANQEAIPISVILPVFYDAIKVICELTPLLSKSESYTRNRVQFTLNF